MEYLSEIVNLIVRPYRDQYSVHRLGKKHICVDEQSSEAKVQVERQDSFVFNKDNQKIELSYYQVLKSSEFYSQNRYDTCLLYLHTNNGSRVEGLTYLQSVLKLKINVCLFDCSGSGLSQGKYVTLGIKQSKDLDSVVNFLVKSKGITKVILWGRSMGANTALIYASKPSLVQIIGLILDTPFKDLEKLIKQNVSEKTGIPKPLLNPLTPLIRHQMIKKTGYSTEDLKMKQYLTHGHQSNVDKNHSKCQPLKTIPVLLIASKNDKLVKAHHIQKLYRRYPSNQKILFYTSSQHHEVRNQQTIDRCLGFLKEILGSETHCSTWRAQQYHSSHKKILNNSFTSLGSNEETKAGSHTNSLMPSNRYHHLPMSLKNSCIHNQDQNHDLKNTTERINQKVAFERFFNEGTLIKRDRY